MRGDLFLPPVYDLPSDKEERGHAVLWGLKLLLSPELMFNFVRDTDDLLTLVGDYLVWGQESIDFLRKWYDEDKYSGFKCLSDREFLEATAFSRACREEYGLEGPLLDYRNKYKHLYTKILRNTIAVLEDWLPSRLANAGNRIAVLADFLCLDAPETSLLEFLYCYGTQRFFKRFLSRLNCSSQNAGVTALASVLQIDAQYVHRMIGPKGRLKRLGCIETDAGPDDLSEIVSPSNTLAQCFSWDFSDVSELARNLLQELRASKSLTIEDFDHLGKDRDIILNLVRQTLKRGEQGVNILLYGGTGTGKTEFARCLAAALDIEAYSVATQDSDGDSPIAAQRLLSLRLSQQFLQGRQDAILVFDEAEDIFGSSRDLLEMFSTIIPWYSGCSATSKAWLTESLELAPVPTIWISNAINRIDPAILRRFQYQLHFRQPPVAKRRSMVQRHFQNAPVSEKCIEFLAQDAQLPPGALHAASRLASLAGDDSRIPCDSIVRQYVKNYRQAMGLKKSEPNMDETGEFDVRFYNTKGSAPLLNIVEAVARTGRGTMLLYGISGTGKTSLTRHLADKIGKPLLKKTASDLLDKYVGGTEKAIARMFEEAVNQDSVLFLDEADSLMRTREKAYHSWEASQVNELLQHMEVFDGVFVCATNLMRDIDTAAMRRFVFKIEFLPLTGAQRHEMFIRHALDGDASRMTVAFRRVLDGLDRLTPGDFAVVTRQASILQESFLPDEFLLRLQDELQAKPLAVSGHIGF